MAKIFVSYSYETSEGLQSFGNTSFILSYRKPYMSDIRAFEEQISSKNPHYCSVTILNFQEISCGQDIEN